MNGMESEYLHGISWHVEEVYVRIQELNTAVKFGDRPFVLQCKELAIPESPGGLRIGCIVYSALLPQVRWRCVSELVVCKKV